MLTTHHAIAVEIVINDRKSWGNLPFTRVGPRFAQHYIIPSNSSFQTSSGANKCSCKLMAAGRQQFCGDTINILGRQDQNFQWSREYSYYSSRSAQNEVIWTSGIALAGCVHEVFDCKELVSWCAEKYISSQRIIPLHDHSPVSLSPQGFHKMLRLSEQTLTFIGQDCKHFLDKHDNELDILPKFLENLTTVPEDITKLQVSSLMHSGKLLGCLHE